MEDAATRGWFPVQPLMSRLVEPLTLGNLIRKHTVWPYSWALGQDLRWKIEQEKHIPWNILFSANDYFPYRWPRADILKLCPTCVTADYDTFGEPYWHVSHQLDVHVCHKHGDSLIDRCHVCHKRLEAQGFLLPSPRCKCGQMFISERGHDDSHQRHFARTTHDLLTATIEAPLDSEQVHLAIEEALRDKGFYRRDRNQHETLNSEALVNAIGRRWKVTDRDKLSDLSNLSCRRPSERVLATAIGYLFPSVTTYLKAVQRHESGRKSQQLAG